VPAEFPELTRGSSATAIVYHDRYDLGVAVQTDQGLVVPVVRGCDEKSLDELEAEVTRLADAARAGKLKPEELRGSTFTSRAPASSAGLLTTPIVNHPEVAILSVGRIAERPVVRDGEIQARPVGTIAVTFDHRVIDGAPRGGVRPRGDRSPARRVNAEPGGEGPPGSCREGPRPPEPVGRASRRPDA
jgi:pyruvate/2-oxoglutarate dehydrogenase complex dihydrolipoamide acyltransferase (E2) component